MRKPTVALKSGLRLACHERPGGEVPLVLLHGISDDARTWAPILDAFHPRCRVFALDFRGHGESDKPDVRYDTEAYAEDVRAFVGEVAGSPALLLGHSLGGVVAVQMAATAPELVRGLILEDPPLYFVNDLTEPYRVAFQAMVQMAKTLQDGSRSHDDWFAVVAAAPDPYTGRPGIETMGEALIRTRIDAIGRMLPKAMEDGLDGSLVWDTDAVLERIAAPLLLLAGVPELGGVMTGPEVDRTARLVPGSRVLRYDDLGHQIHNVRPDAFVAAVNGWIDEVLAGA